MGGISVARALTDTSLGHRFCICSGILPDFNAVTALCLKYLLITRVAKIQGHFHVPLASEGAVFSPAYSIVICCVNADIMANSLLPWLFGKECTHDCG